MRVRFAPSPTGFLHIGNARTAIINHLISKKNNATFILRIEDTDMERSTKESELSILEDLKWLGIDWQEGPDKGGEYGPYRQSERLDIYKKYTEQLLIQGDAFKCFCTPEEVEHAKKEAEKEQKSYQDACRNLNHQEVLSRESSGKTFAVRFKVPDNETICVNDHIKGKIEFNTNNIGGDFIIVRSDGIPVYNYIVSIDDTLMKVTHVIRGEDHLSNTPKQLLVAKALKLPIPEYAHLALVLGPDKTKLSKRHGLTSVEQYRKKGYLAEALINYIAMLGWASTSGEEIMQQDDIIKTLELNSLSKSAAVFDFQKLSWMNGIYIRNYNLQHITDLFIPYINSEGFQLNTIQRTRLENIIDLIRGNCELLSDIILLIGIFLNDINMPDSETDELLKEDDSKRVIKTAYNLFQSDIEPENCIDQLIQKVKEDTGFKGKKLFHPIRAILTGRLSGPDLKLAMPLIGFENCKKRVEFCYKSYYKIKI